jgi:hypothetical protein
MLTLSRAASKCRRTNTTGAKNPLFWRANISLGCYVNCYVAGDFQLVSRRVRASCQCEAGEKIAHFELVSSCLHARQVLKTGNTKVFQEKGAQKRDLLRGGFLSGSLQIGRRKEHRHSPRRTTGERVPTLDWKMALFTTLRPRTISHHHDLSDIV